MSRPPVGEETWLMGGPWIFCLSPCLTYSGIPGTQRGEDPAPDPPLQFHFLDELGVGPGHGQGVPKTLGYG
jgi:hypothetical protein